MITGVGFDQRNPKIISPLIHISLLPLQTNKPTKKKERRKRREESEVTKNITLQTLYKDHVYLLRSLADPHDCNR